LVLVNALRFVAQWADPFKTADTGDREFTREDGSRVSVPMMSGSPNGSAYLSGTGWEAIRMSYHGAELAMTLVKTADAGAAAHAEWLSAGGLDHLTTAEAGHGARIVLPRWTFRSPSRLNDTLTRLGIPDAFDDTRADFSGITRAERLKIAAVLHEAYVAVDEVGTEAAAATAVVIALSMGSAGPPREVVFDRPFLFVIHDTATNAPLFVGRVADPSAT